MFVAPVECRFANAGDHLDQTCTPAHGPNFGPSLMKRRQRQSSAWARRGQAATWAETPMIVSQSDKIDSDSRVLSVRDATLHRRLVAKLNYLAMDCPDIFHAASIMESLASSPKDADMVKLERVGRCLLGRPTTWTHHRWGCAI